MIQVLDSALSNMIAAGEVVERPMSVVKELCENAIDAGATAVTVEISGGGLDMIRVSDNGSGIEPNDVETAFLCHATSKISKPDDLSEIRTLGFRGEALASICAVSRVEIQTKAYGYDFGVACRLEAGDVIYRDETGCAQGTVMTVRDLFFNTPARKKFLRKDYTEAGYIEEAVRKLALAHPEISFRYINERKEKIFTPGDARLENAALCLYGKDVARELLPIQNDYEGVRVEGLVGNISLYKKNRSMQTFFVNNRCIVNRAMAAALEEAYKGLLAGGCFPVAMIKLFVDPASVDVNVHPAKLEVKFVNESAVYKAVYWAVKNAVSANKITPMLSVQQEMEPPEAQAPLAPQPRPDKPETPIQRVREELPLRQYMEPPGSNVNAASSSHMGSVVREEYVQPRRMDPALQQTLAAFLEDESETQTESGRQQAPLQTTEGAAQERTGMDKHDRAAGTVEEPEVKQTGLALEQLRDYRVIGQLFATYIMLEQEGKLIIIDQHAAHERLIYERLVQQRSKHAIAPQQLLVPEVVKLTPVEKAFVLENDSMFETLGFEVEDFGSQDVALRSVPAEVEMECIADMFTEVVTLGMKNANSLTPAVQERMLYTVACRAAIKASKILTQQEMERLVDDVMKTPNTLTCPHGRPVTVALDKTFMEKLFKRKL